MSQVKVLSGFAKDTLKGLTSPRKFLQPKYFYDTEGSKIFQQIMHMPEYYLTNCEMEIFRTQSMSMAQWLHLSDKVFDLIELGPGDGIKSKILLKELHATQKSFTYLPVDISAYSLEQLSRELTKEIPGLQVKQRAGDYFSVMEDMAAQNGTSRVILFLGSNIGNFLPHERAAFMQKVSAMTSSGDGLLMGFDLKKSPAIIQKAYDDPHGYTRAFNLNHLQRINRELDADFDLRNFEHHASYHPETGEMKSFLVSNKAHSVSLNFAKTHIHFDKWEPVFMELSQKFDFKSIEELARNFGFSVKKNFLDTQGYFTDSLWIKK